MALYKRNDKEESDTDDMRCHESLETDYVKSAINKWQLSPVLTLLQEQTGTSVRSSASTALGRRVIAETQIEVMAGAATMGESFFEDLSKEDLAVEPEEQTDCEFFFEFGASRQMAKV